MNRRSFLSKFSTLGAFTAAGLPAWAAPSRPTAKAAAFTLNYAPHFGMFRSHAGSDVVEQLEFMARQGFGALEDNNMRSRPAAEQRRIADTMEGLNMEMGVFVAHTIGWDAPNLTSNDSSLHQNFIDEIKQSVRVARRVNATWMTVVPGRLHPTLEMGYQTTNVVRALRRAAAILEPEGMVMVLEPLNPYQDHPGQFLTGTSQAYQICKAVDSPACKILYDVYHQQITEGNLIPNIEKAWDEIAYFQVGDNPGRNEPTTGEINYANVFKYIAEKGYRGIIGMEHGNARSGKEGEQAVIEAYRSVDPKAG